MSSIYRKGRDGYFYYQSYVFNPSTGKKDKRIFHSLGTKDKDEAKRKQVKFDLKYNENKKNTNKKVYKKYARDFVLVASTFLLTLFFSDFLLQKEKSRSLEDKISYENLPADFNDLDPNDGKKKSMSEEQLVMKENVPNKIKKSDNLERSIISAIDILPDYNVKRVESISGAFAQGKIFVNVEDQYKKGELLLICEKIAKDYSDYSNIIICIYDNSEIGHELAMGQNKQIAPENHKQAWLAMYTLNPVEGAYFDDNPGSYLGSF